MNKGAEDHLERARRPSLLLAAMSLLLSVAIIELWLSGLRDPVVLWDSRRSLSNDWAVQSSAGGLRLMHTTTSHVTAIHESAEVVSAGWVDVFHADGRYAGGSGMMTQSPLENIWFRSGSNEMIYFVSATQLMTIGGPNLTAAAGPPGYLALRMMMSFVSVPLWPLLLLSMILPVRWLWSLIARRRRVKGACRGCGYDLRASNERCPECGMAIPTQYAAN